MIHKQNFYIINCLILCSAILTSSGNNAFSQEKEFTDAQLKVKHDRLRTYMDRAAELKKSGYMPKALAEAREAVKVAEEEFGSTHLVVIKPLFELIDLLGQRRYFEEAEKYFDKVYKIIRSKGDSGTLYAVAYRLRIARIYLSWNMFEKAEIALKTAKLIANTADTDMKHYITAIDSELEKVAVFMEANSYRTKKKKR